MSQHKELPLLFQPDMAAQTALGNKDQTRRMTGLKDINRAPDLWSWEGFRLDNKTGFPEHVFCNQQTNETIYVVSPYGGPGTHLWVRETWQCFEPDTDTPTATIPKQREGVTLAWVGAEPYREQLGFEPYTGKWRPSIHMPRWASRLLLQVKEVRIERLQELTEEDALAEGLSEFTKDTITYKYGVGVPNEDSAWRDWKESAKEAYADLWESINGAGSWAKNPFVWVVVYEVVENLTPGLPVAAPEPEPSLPALATVPAAELLLYPSIRYLQEDTRPVHDLLNEAYERGLGDLNTALATKARPCATGRPPGSCINDLPTPFVHVFNLIVLARTTQVSLPHFLASVTSDEARLFKPFTQQLTAFVSNALTLLLSRKVLKPGIDADGQPMTERESAVKFSNDMANLLYECLWELNQASDPREPHAAMKMFNRYGLVQEVPEGVAEEEEVAA